MDVGGAVGGRPHQARAPLVGAAGLGSFIRRMTGTWFYSADIYNMLPVSAILSRLYNWYSIIDGAEMVIILLKI